MSHEQESDATGGCLAATAVAACATGVPMLFLFPAFWAAVEVLRFRRQRPDEGFGMNRTEYELATGALEAERLANAGLVEVFERAEDAGCRPRSDAMWSEKNPRAAALNEERLQHEEKLKGARWDYHVARTGPSSRFSAWRAANSAAWGARAVAFAWVALILIFPNEAQALVLDSLAVFTRGLSDYIDVAMRALVPVSLGLVVFVATFWVRAKVAERHRPPSSSQLIDHYAEHHAGTPHDRLKRDLSRVLVERIDDIDDIEEERELEIVSMAAIMRFIVSADGQFSEGEKEAIYQAEADLVGDDVEAKELFRSVFESLTFEDEVLDAAIGLQALLLDSPDHIDDSSLLELVKRLAASDEFSPEEEYRMRDVRKRMIRAWRELEEPE